jgi:hypothetical protein
MIQSGGLSWVIMLLCSVPLTSVAFCFPSFFATSDQFWDLVIPFVQYVAGQNFSLPILAWVQVAELRKRTDNLPDDYFVVLVGDMITEEALPTYMAMLNTLDGVRDETGAQQTPWGRCLLPLPPFCGHHLPSSRV